MATVKGKYKYVWGDVEIMFTIHLLCDEGSSIATWLLREVGRIVQGFTDGRDYTLDDILENQTLIERVLMDSKFKTGAPFASAPVSLFASKIDLEFTQIVEQRPRSEVMVLSSWPEPVVADVAQDVESAEPTKAKTIADEVRQHIAAKADRLVAVSNVTKELLERYAPEMESDPDLEEALTNLLATEKINAFD